jgi:hypothetical protein
MPAAEPVERLLAALADATAGGDGAAPGLRPIAVGWATVELDRAADELAADLAIEPDAFVPAAARAVLPGGASIAILEPSTEGRLVAILVRHDEGPAAIWFETDEAGAAELPAGRVVPGGGPFGPERLLGAGPPDRFLVDRAPGTIAT